MSAETNSHSLMNGALRDFRSSWKSLFLCDIVFKVIALIVLTPLVGVLFRTLIALSGRAVMSDMDILYFFLGPVGWMSGIVVGALWLGIVALEQAALMGILWAKGAGKALGPEGALGFAAGRAGPVIRVTARIVALTLLAMAPFLAAAALVYFTLLGEFDINYYLKEKPPAFRTAVGIGLVIAAAMVVLLLRLFTSWFFAVPIVVFEDVDSRQALKASASRAHGRRRTLLYWMVGWALAMTLLSALVTGAVGLIGRLVTPDSTNSLHALAVAVGVTLLLWGLVNLAVNLLSTTTFATILFNLYRELGRDGVADAVSAVSVAETSNQRRFRISRTRLFTAGIIGIAIAVVVGGLALESVRLDDDVQIMAHRGSSKSAPENTMAAFQTAIEEGADWIELDVQETADGEVVVMHDSDFMKLASNDLKIWDATLDDLKDIDIGSWFAAEFKDQRVPTLADVLEECKGKIGVNIELKYYGHDEQLEQRVAEIVDAHDMASDVMAMSLKMEGVKKMKSVRPDWKVGLLMSVSAGNLGNLDADFIAVNAGFADRRLVRDAHDNGKEVYVWTVNDALTMSTMISRGVDGLLTDKPALAKSVLEQRAQMSAPQRVLLELSRLLGTVPEVGEQ